MSVYINTYMHACIHTYVKQMYLKSVFVLQPKLVVLFGLSGNYTISAIVRGTRIIIIICIICANIYALFSSTAALYMY